MHLTPKWSFHKYLTDRDCGLHSKLELSHHQEAFLKDLRSQSRMRIREVFTEAKDVIRDVEKMQNAESREMRMYNAIKSKSSFQHLDPQLFSVLISLASNMDNDERNAFLKIRPKFRTQGSFEYKTLNVPYRKPPQEMDIDDGVYFPMQMFDGAPALTHRLMIALVDSALQSLAFENEGWDFDDSKPTCARIRIKERNVHLDVPMYAVPEEKYEQMMESLASLKLRADYTVTNDAWSLSEQTLLDRDCVHLARRDKDKWQKSDPQVVQQWFTDSVKEVGEHLRLACRFLKAWRDVCWPDGGGPSSIALMKCTVDTLGNSLLDGKDLGLVMAEVIDKLPEQLSNGVESPDPSDQRPLFPDISQHNNKEREILTATKYLQSQFVAASTAQTKDECTSLLRSIFGERGISVELITVLAAAKVYNSPAQISEPAKIDRTMKSG